MIARTAHLALAVLTLAASTARAQQVWLEAESFANHGGWMLDTQFIDIMGSPYLLAHGMGAPVKDAATEVKLPGAGEYRLWVRTKNWVGPWDAPAPPGRFQISFDGHKASREFGAHGKDWQWEDGGSVSLKANTTVVLHDMTGLEGRVDAILLSRDSGFTPPADVEGTNRLRHSLLGLPQTPPETTEYDLVVVGGGYSGLGAAISAARQGLRVALIQNRPVLGGNGSSEVQVWAQGGTRRGLYPHLGEIVEEFADRASNSPAADPAEFNDKLKEEVVRAEKLIDLFLNTHVYAVEMAGGDEKKIRSVTGLDTRTGKETRFRGKFFSDCTGHGTVGFLAGASYMQEEKGRMGMSNMWVLKRMAEPKPWPKTPWALDLNMGDFPEPQAMEPYGVKNKSNQAGFDPGFTPIVREPEEYLHGEWFWESGFDKDPIKDLELIRDWNFRAVYGAVTALKEEAPEKYKNYDLTWLAYIGGTRESRRLIGDFILPGEDMVKGVVHPDACVPTTWDQDLHYPKEQYATKFPDNPFISRAQFGKHTDRKSGYPVPYRCLYSKDIGNLFMAGRNISVDRFALGSTRVMRTCGMFGEVVGKAAWISVRHHTTPRGVYEQYLDILKELMSKPGAMRRDALEGNLYMPTNAKKLPEVVTDSIEVAKMEGIVIDDEEAELVGKWAKGEGLKPYVGKHYSYSQEKGASARFAFSVKESGAYEVLVYWQPHANRAKSAPISILSADGEKTVLVDQSQPAGTPRGAHSLGTFTFNAGEEAAVVFRTAGSQGNVHLDAVQVVKR